MKSIVYKSAVLERVYNLVKCDAVRRNKSIFKRSDIRRSVYDQLTIEHNGYDFMPSEIDALMAALEEYELIIYVSYADGENYYEVV